RRARTGEVAQAAGGGRAARRLRADVRAEPVRPMRNRQTRLETTIGCVLRFGVTISSVCLALGLALSLFHGPAATSNLLLTSGLVILMATPVGRVVISIVEIGRASCRERV